MISVMTPHAEYYDTDSDRNVKQKDTPVFYY